MAGTTPTWALPYPVSTDPADVPKDVLALANRLDTLLTQINNAIPQAALAGDTKWVAYPVAAGSEATQAPGWLLCDGREVSRTTYAALFAKVGTAHGVGDGSATFNLPDHRGRTVVGSGAGPGLTARNLGARGGEESHVLSVGELPSHNHGGATAAGTTSAGTTGGGTTGASTTGAADRSLNSSTDSQGDHNHAPSDFTGFAHTGGNTAALGASQTSRYLVSGWSPRTATAGAHSHGVYGIDHLHSIPGLSIPGLAIPGLAVPPLAITAQGGGAGHNVIQPFVVLNLLIKT